MDDRAEYWDEFNGIMRPLGSNRDAGGSRRERIKSG